MSKRLHTVEIEGYGPVTIKSLTKRQLETSQARFGDDVNQQLVHVIRLGMHDPKCTDDFLASLGDPDVLPRIAEAILARSWPNQEI